MNRENKNYTEIAKKMVTDKLMGLVIKDKNVALRELLSGLHKREVAGALAAFGIIDRLHRDCGQLSNHFDLHAHKRDRCRGLVIASK